jgi:hypothetical protein
VIMLLMIILVLIFWNLLCIMWDEDVASRNIQVRFSATGSIFEQPLQILPSGSTLSQTGLALWPRLQGCSSQWISTGGYFNADQVQLFTGFVTLAEGVSHCQAIVFLDLSCSRALFLLVPLAFSVLGLQC